MKHYTKSEIADMRRRAYTLDDINPVRIHTLEHPSPPPPLANDTPVPDKRRNGKTRRQSYGATVATRPATTLDGKVIVWGNQALARAAMLTLMR